MFFGLRSLETNNFSSIDAIGCDDDANKLFKRKIRISSAATAAKTRESARLGTRRLLTIAAAAAHDHDHDHE